MANNANGGAQNNNNDNNKIVIKVEEIKPHPVMEQLPGVQYCVNSPPPWGQLILLGFQHYILTLGTTVLIPSMFVNQMGGNNVQKAQVIQTLLFVSGISTLIQSLFGTRLPSIISGSYSYIIPMTSIIYAKRFQPLDPTLRFESTIRAMQGALMVASSFQIVLGFSGIWRNVIRYFTPLSMVPLITFTGLGLSYLGFPLLMKCVEVGLPQLILLILLTQYVPRVAMINKYRISDKYTILISISVMWIFAEVVDSCGARGKSSDDVSASNGRFSLIGGSPWVYIPRPFPWGRPTVRFGEACALLVASFVSSTESTGAFLVAARYGSATPVPPSVLSRGVGWMGFGTFLCGMFGTVTGTSASVENAGLLALTKVGSRRVVQISALFMIFFSILGKFGAFFASIPLPIMAALYCFFFGYVSSAGLGLLQYCNLNSYRTKSILGLSFFFGLSIPQYFREFQLTTGHSPAHTRFQSFNDIITVIFTSHALMAAMVAVLLDCTLEREKDDEAKKNSGSQWWEKFVSYNTDLRSHDFYKLPLGLNYYFPAY